MLQRPKNEEELQKREAIGTIRASRFIRKYSRKNKPITVCAIQAIHREIFTEAWPEIAGKYRNEEIEISDSEHHPPHFLDIPGLMERLNIKLASKLNKLNNFESSVLEDDIVDADDIKTIDDIISVAAWLHHEITHIHPFREGNGRTARLAANLILERYGLFGISIKIEKENKDRYRKALSQIDKKDDYGPLENIISEGLSERANDVPVKYYNNKE